MLGKTGDGTTSLIFRMGAMKVDAVFLAHIVRFYEVGFTEKAN